VRRNLQIERTHRLRGDTLRFQCFEAARPEEILEDLVNLPGDDNTKELEAAAKQFLARWGPLRKGYDTVSATAGFRSSFRSFWTIDEWPVGLRKSGMQTKGDILCSLLGGWPHSDPRVMMERIRGSWAVNWETGTVFIRALDPLAVLAHTVFVNRNRLRKCKNSECGRFFISDTPRGDYCPSKDCALRGRRTSHNRSYHKTKAANLKKKRVER
jgi:hypothetical protein